VSSLFDAGRREKKFLLALVLLHQIPMTVNDEKI